MHRKTATVLTQADEGAELHRTAFTTSRALEFFSVKELTMQIGFPMPMWPLALVKELTDNGLDGCENAGIPPCIEIVVEANSVSVQDNGPGLPLATLKGSLDYNFRISDKAYYVSPTRGQLGNALKCVWAAPSVASGNQCGRVEVITEGRRHLIDVTLDRIAQAVQLNDAEEQAFVQNGAFVKMHWPGVASCLTAPETLDLYNSDGFEDDFSVRGDPFNVYRLVQAYAAFNPHTTFFLTGPDGTTVELAASNPNWRKWLPRDPTSPHWYDLNRFQALLGANLTEERSNGRRRTVREFVREFNGLKRSDKQKAVAEVADLARDSLQDLVRGATWMPTWRAGYWTR